MSRKYIFVVSVGVWLLAFVCYARAGSEQNKCECNFDTPKYTASCDCALICAVAVENGKDCNIVCDGTPSSAEKGNYSAYGRPSKFLNDMANINRHVLSSGFKAFYDKSFSRHALPRLMRSAYIGASFISPEKKYELDTLIKSMFSRFGNEITREFTEPAKKVFRKEIQRGALVNISYKSIKLSFSDFEIYLLFIK